ncbi:NAD-dependent epimerase/dehydratase family protein [Halomonas sp. GXIMD04776]|uniref:NAD-dependent epimerase/dehydratase family protein n=1 Tax=Halomonas sp. GXIMD04776 TaxID=3415605 RepID=UPI003CA2205C
MKNTCLILGCGDIGKTLGTQLIEAGHRVIGARRNPEELAASGIEPLAIDLNDPESLKNLPDANIVIYVVSADRFDEQAYQAAYRDGLRAVLAELDQRTHKPARMFFVSSTSVYAQQDGEAVDENTLTQPTGFAGQLMREAEQTLIAHDLPGTVVRFSGIYGPGRDRLIQQVREGRIAAATPPMYSNRIHRDDCAGVLSHLIAKTLNDEPLDELYLASDCEPVPLHEVMAWLAKRLEVETHEVIQSPLRRRSSKRCDNSRLRETGYEFRYPTFREGYAQVLASAHQGRSQKA